MGSIFSTPSSTWTSKGKNVLITGASSGIGAELARLFAQQGARLALIARSKDALNSVAKECLELGAASAEVFTCDLTDNDDIRTAMEGVAAKFSNVVDVVVLNAGRSQGCYFEEIKDTTQIDYMVQLNLTSIIRTMHHLLPYVPKTSDSRIVVISSTAGIVGVPYRTVYCATKFGLTGFCNTLRIELKDTYGSSAPPISLINFPEVSGTKLNTGRMDFGADLPPAEFDIGQSNVLPLSKACEDAMAQIIAGAREWGQPWKVSLLRPLSSFIPNLIDMIVLKHVKKGSYRPRVGQ